jgi:hypothetical protein
MIPATGSRRILQERCGKVTGNPWKMEAVFQPEIVRNSTERDEILPDPTGSDPPLWPGEISIT